MAFFVTRHVSIAPTRSRPTPATAGSSVTRTAIGGANGSVMVRCVNRSENRTRSGFALSGWNIATTCASTVLQLTRPLRSV